MSQRPITNSNLNYVIKTFSCTSESDPIHRNLEPPTSFHILQITTAIPNALDIFMNYEYFFHPIENPTNIPKRDVYLRSDISKSSLKPIHVLKKRGRMATGEVYPSNNMYIHKPKHKHKISFLPS